jgi:MT0933-like antitoxin protein
MGRLWVVKIRTQLIKGLAVRPLMRLASAPSRSGRRPQTRWREDQMSIMDKLKSMAGKHSDKVQKGLDQAAQKADQKTGGKYGEKIDTARDRAKDFISKQSQRGGDEGQDPGGSGPSGQR